MKNLKYTKSKTLQILKGVKMNIIRKVMKTDLGLVVMLVVTALVLIVVFTALYKSIALYNSIEITQQKVIPNTFKNPKEVADFLKIKHTTNEEIGRAHV